jgi:DnaK suppressor protein
MPRTGTLVASLACTTGRLVGRSLGHFGEASKREVPMMRKATVGDHKRYEVLSAMLRERQSEIRNKLRSLREVLPSESAQVKDAEEQSMEDFVLGMDFALMEMESETLRKIDEALQRLEAGTYGVCVECNGKVAEARLKALPFASTCRECQQQQEDIAASQRPQRTMYEEAPPVVRGRAAVRA